MLWRAAVGCCVCTGHFQLCPHCGIAGFEHRPKWIQKFNKTPLEELQEDFFFCPVFISCYTTEFSMKLKFMFLNQSFKANLYLSWWPVWSCGFFIFQMNMFVTTVNGFSSIWKGFWSVRELYDTYSGGSSNRWSGDDKLTAVHTSTSICNYGPVIVVSFILGLLQSCG